MQISRWVKGAAIGSVLGFTTVNTLHSKGIILTPSVEQIHDRIVPESMGYRDYLRDVDLDIKCAIKHKGVFTESWGG